MTTTAMTNRVIGEEPPRGLNSFVSMAMIVERLHLAPILQSKLSQAPLDIDNPSWVVDDQFDIDRHILRASLPAPASQEQLQRTVGWMHAKLLNRARPLWEFYVFEGLPNNEVALYSKVHHACIDGGAGAALTEIVYDVSPEPRIIEKVAPTRAPEPRETAQNFMDQYLKLWTLSPGEATQGLAALNLPRSGRSDSGSFIA